MRGGQSGHEGTENKWHLRLFREKRMQGSPGGRKQAGACRFTDQDAELGGSWETSAEGSVSVSKKASPTQIQCQTAGPRERPLHKTCRDTVSPALFSAPVQEMGSGSLQ